VFIGVHLWLKVMTSLPNNFSWPLACKLASYCAQAYDRDDITDAATNAAAIVTLDEADDIIVAFRGSRAARDFVQDAKVGFTTLAYVHSAADLQSASGADISADYKSAALSPAKVHEGFLQDFEAIDLAVTSNVRTYLAIHPQARIWLTGHSLGGALAILCAYQFAKQRLPVAGVYTFGQPRVGNTDFADGYDYEIVAQASRLRGEGETLSPAAAGTAALPTEHLPAGGTPALRDITFRIVNQNDLVPRVPGWLMGYRHCGQEIFLRPDGRAEANPSLIEKLLWDAVGLYGAYRHREDVLLREHHIGAYMERMQKEEL
jgi:hypothetical protein